MNKQSPLWLTLALGFLVLCMGVILITGPLQAPVEWRGFWNTQYVPAVTQVVEAAQVIVVTAQPPAPTEVPAVEADLPVCFFSSWHDGWTNGPKRLSYVGAFNKTALESGTSLQASSGLWTSDTEVNGLVIPAGYEPGNDAAFQALICGNTVYMPARESSAEFPFWLMSYAKLTSDGLLLCQDDTGSRGTWEGECAGIQTVVKGIPLDDITVPSDFQENWSKLMNLMESWDSPTPDHGIFTEMWIPQ